MTEGEWIQARADRAVALPQSLPEQQGGSENLSNPNDLEDNAQ